MYWLAKLLKESGLWVFISIAIAILAIIAIFYVANPSTRSFVQNLCGGNWRELVGEKTADGIEIFVGE